MQSLWFLQQKRNHCTGLIFRKASKILCDEDCKGICKKCGQNLNDGACECDDFVPDIRFANLMDIFNGSK